MSSPTVTLPTIPQTDPRAGYLAQKAAIDAAIARVLDGGWYILGKEVIAFENEFAAYIGAAHGIGVANGTDALVLAMKALGVGAGDVVATVSHTAVATVAAVEMTGAEALVLDIDPATYTMDPAALRRALQGPLGSRIKAVIPVHIYGQPADLGAIAPLVRRHGARLIEDCSQCHGARLDGRRAGTFGDIACYSLYPTKNLGALGDGGVVTTDDASLAAEVKAIREYGWRERYISDRTGVNSRLDELQAALLRVKLAELDADNARRQAVAAIYDEGLADLGLVLPARQANATHVFHQYVVRVPGDAAQRDGLRERLKAKGVATNVHYPQPIHLQPAYRGRIATGEGGLPHTERAALSILSLPMFPQLGTANGERVVAALRAALRNES